MVSNGGLRPSCCFQGIDPNRILALLQWLSVEEEVANNLATYIVSDFSYLSNMPAISQAAYILEGVIDIPLAKISEIWGLDTGFALMIFFNTLGLLMVAVCQNIVTYAAGKVFFQVGFHGLTYLMTVFVADMAGQKYRGLLLGMTNIHTIVSAFAGPALAQHFNDHSTFRWAFVVLLLVSLVMSLPVYALFRYHRKHTQNASGAPERSSHNWLEATKEYFIQIDGTVLATFSPGPFGFPCL